MSSTQQHQYILDSQQQQQQPQPIIQDESPRKKRKISRIEEEELKKTDKIDPVEKLLSLSNINQDFLSDFDSQSEQSSEDDCEEQQLDEYEDDEALIEIENVNFTQIIQENIRQFYVKRRLENQYKDTFSLLNNKDQEEEEAVPTKSQQTQQSQQPISKPIEVPFFKNVNFGNKPKEYAIEDYFSYNDEEEEDQGSLSESSSRNSLSVSSEEEYSDSSDESDVSPITTPKSETQSLYIPKINHHHHYYHCGLGMVNGAGQQYYQQRMDNVMNQEEDLSKILNKNSLINGKASEMVSTGNFMINDFFL